MGEQVEAMRKGVKIVWLGTKSSESQKEDTDSNLLKWSSKVDVSYNLFYRHYL